MHFIEILPISRITSQDESALLDQSVQIHLPIYLSDLTLFYFSFF